MINPLCFAARCCPSQEGLGPKHICALHGGYIEDTELRYNAVMIKYYERNMFSKLLRQSVFWSMQDSKEAHL